MFKLSLTEEDLHSYVFHQLNNFFPDNQLACQDLLFKRSLQQALERTEYCFQHVALKAYHHDGVTRFSHLHADQYTLFLWYLSNAVWKVFEDDGLASKVFSLNKVLNGFLCMYDTNMPDIFLVLHGEGTVLGKAVYGNFFVCCHGCTVGAVHWNYPSLGKGVAMAPQSTIVGDCIVGDNVTIGTHALLRNRNVDSGHLYYQDVDTGRAMTKQVKESWAQSFFNVPIGE